MGETSKCAQFITFKTSPGTTINEELFQEVWIPSANEFRVRGIDSIILSRTAEAKHNFNDSHFVSKTWWDSSDAVQVAFPDGLKNIAPTSHEVLGLRTAPITLTQVTKQLTSRNATIFCNCVMYIL